VESSEMQKRQQEKLFTLDYIEKELDKLDGVLDGPLKIFVAGGFDWDTPVIHRVKTRPIQKRR
jgi:hypothetical protein